MKTILYAEDTKDLQEIVVDLLTMEGFAVLACDDGQEAWDYLTGEGNALPDLIITDMMMPKMNGMELLTRVKANFHEVKCLVYSASPEFKERCDAMSCHFVHKPFDLDLLMKLITQTLEEDYHEKKSETRPRGARFT